MAGYDYKCVPVPESIFTGKIGEDSHGAAVTAYENIIKDAAKNGWELVQADSVISYQKPGCLGALFGRHGETRKYKLLIFKKPL